MANKYSKLLIWTMVIALMPTFLLLSFLRGCGAAGGQQEALLTVAGVEQNPAIWDAFETRWQQLDYQPSTQREYFSLPAEWMDVRNRLLPQPAGREGEDPDAYTGRPFTSNMFVRYLLAKEKYGIEIHPDEVNAYVQDRCLQRVFQIKDLRPPTLQEHCGSLGLRPQQHQQLVRELLTILKMERMVEMVVQTDPLAVRDQFLEENEMRKVKYLELPASTFEREIKIEPLTEDELIDFFGKNRVDYDVPDRYRIEYVAIALEDEKAALPPSTPEELEKYYDSNTAKFGFRVKKNPEETPEPPPLSMTPVYRDYKDLNDDEKADVKKNFESDWANKNAHGKLDKVRKAAEDRVTVDAAAIVSGALEPVGSLSGVTDTAPRAVRALEGTLDAANNQRADAVYTAAQAAGLAVHESALLSADALNGTFSQIAGEDLNKFLSPGTGPTPVGQISDVLGNDATTHLYFVRILEKADRHSPGFGDLEPDERARLVRAARQAKREREAGILAYRKANEILKQMQKEGHTFEEVAAEWRVWEKDEPENPEAKPSLTIPETGYFKKNSRGGNAKESEEPLTGIDLLPDALDRFRQTAFALEAGNVRLANEPRETGGNFYIIKLVDDEPIRPPTFEQFQAGRSDLERNLRGPMLETFRFERFKAIAELFDYEPPKRQSGDEDAPAAPPGPLGY